MKWSKLVAFEEHMNTKITKRSVNLFEWALDNPAKAFAMGAILSVAYTTILALIIRAIL